MFGTEEGLVRTPVMVTEDVTLVEVLRSLRSLPFTQDSVDAYKQDRAREATPLIPVETEAGKLNVRWVLEAVIVFNFAVWILTGFVVSGIIAFGWAAPGYALIFFLTMCVGLRATHNKLVTFEAYTLKGRATWHRRIVRDLDELPEGITALAGAIKREVPNVTFIIDELFQNKQVIDPFLVIEHEGSHYYIAVWDEPGHNAQRET